MSMLLRSSESEPISVFGQIIPLRLARWIVRFCVAAVMVGSLLPGSGKEKLGLRTGKTAHVVGHLTIKHRLIHVFAFGSSCLLVSLLARNNREELQAAGEMLAVGFLAELGQYVAYSHGKVFEWWDIRDDAIGITVAFFAAHLIHRIGAYRCGKSPGKYHK
jgi:hypothetical protein